MPHRPWRRGIRRSYRSLRFRSTVSTGTRKRPVTRCDRTVNFSCRLRRRIFNAANRDEISSTPIRSLTVEGEREEENEIEIRHDCRLVVDSIAANGVISTDSGERRYSMSRGGRCRSVSDLEAGHTQHLLLRRNCNRTCARTNGRIFACGISIATIAQW